jgi:outer membrane receptor protein involved in Fe transport
MFDLTLGRRLFISALLIVCSGVGLFNQANAQTATGGIRGVVTDASGAAIANASVVVKSPATGVEFKLTSNSEGVYTAPRLLPGNYNVTVEAQGFKKAEFTDITVTLGRDTVIDASLQPGAISEVVNVQGGAEAALVERDSVQISTTFSQKKVAELPINVPGRGLDRVALLTPGVTVGFGNVNGNGVTLSANGQRARSNNFTIDGVDNNDLSIGGPNYFVRNPDVVGEYQVVTNNFSAEYGRNQGAIVNIVSRSGTNKFHGSAQWDHLDQKNFDSLTNLERRTGTQANPVANLDNIFTYAVGGPAIKNKVFFYTTGYFRRNPGVADLLTTGLAPTTAGIAALKAAYPTNRAIQYYADFSAFNLPLGNPTVRAISATPMVIGTTNVEMASVRRQVQRTIIQDEYTFRGDGNLTDKHRVWGRYFWQDSPNVNSGADVRGWVFDSPAQSKQIGGGWNWTLTSRINNEFRFNYSRLFVLFGGGSTGGKGQIPHPDDIDKAFALLTPNFQVGGILPLTVGPATNLPQGRTVESFQYTDNITMSFGSHQLKTGFDLRDLKNTAPFLPNVNGSYRFDTPAVFAANTPSLLTVALGPATLSYGELDKFFYLQDDWRIRNNVTLNLGLRYEHTGQPINLLNDVTVARESNNQTAFWRQNLPIDARVNTRIPVDTNNWAPRLGFVYSPRHDSGFLAKLFGKDRTTIRGGAGMAYDATFYNLMLNISTAAPTVFLTTLNGASAAVPSATPTGDVVRQAAVASGAIAFNTFDPRLLSRTTINPKMRSPYAQQWSFGVQREIFNAVVEARYVGTHGVGLFQTINANPQIGNLLNGFSQAYHDPVTNTAKTLTFPGYRNLLPSGVNALTCTDVASTRDNEAACNGRVFPFGVARERINGAQSIYHSLQTRFDGRFRRDWVYGFTYTWSKSLDNSSEVFNFPGGNSSAVSQNPLQLTGIERGRSGFDVPHSFTALFLWNTPFMKEQKGVLGRIVGGWQLNGILRVQNAVHWTPTQRVNLNPYEDNTFLGTFIGTSALRPFAGNPNAPAGSVAISDVDACLFYALCGTSGGNRILQTSSTGYYSMAGLNAATRTFTPVTPNDVRFIVNGPGAAQRFGTPFGTLSRNTETGDRIESFDFSVFKDFRIKESMKLQYRLQLINALNHPNFGTPNSITIDSAFFNNYQENSGGRRVISMSLRFQF